ncbi:MAG: potassium channel protein [Gammaproteobacteria bacterium]|nr:potassium channel protein [Gammaproteobacteria bacterium]
MNLLESLSTHIANRFIQACLFLDAHSGYQGAKSQARDMLDNPRSQRKRYFDLLMILLVLGSVILLVYGVKNPLSPWMRWFELFAVSVFILEYLGWVWVYSDIHRVVIDHVTQAKFLCPPFRLGPALSDALRKKWEYVSTPLAIIDLLAILPSYRPIRLLRIFLLFRLFKLFRYSRSVQGMSGILAEKRFEFYTLALFITFVVLAASSAVYVFEGGHPGGSIDTFFDAAYWAMVTLSTVGYGDITTVTTEGRVVAMALIVSGIGVLAFSTSIVVSAFQQRLGDLREHRVLGELERVHGYSLICGFGEVGQVVAERLDRTHNRFAVIDQDEEREQLATGLGYLAVCGDVTDNALLERIGVADRVHTLICITGDDVKNVFLTLRIDSGQASVSVACRRSRR